MGINMGIIESVKKKKEEGKMERKFFANYCSTRWIVQTKKGFGFDLTYSEMTELFRLIGRCRYKRLGGNTYLVYVPRKRLPKEIINFLEQQLPQ